MVKRLSSSERQGAGLYFQYNGQVRKILHDYNKKMSFSSPGESVEKNVKKGKKVENCLYLCGNRVKGINSYGHFYRQLSVQAR